MAVDLRMGRGFVVFGFLESPFGTLLAALTDLGLVRLAFPEEDPEAALGELDDELGAPSEEDPPRLARLARELSEYFEGRRRAFTVPPDLSLVPPGFPRRVLAATARIPYGAVSTYANVAARAGSPRAARAAGNALNRNPVPIVVPCHRVVPASGGIGGYGGQEARKETLLRLEGAL